MSLIAAGGMRATKVKYVPARIVEQYIAALKISDKRELFFLPQRSHGRVNTTVNRGLARAPGSAYQPLNEKMPRTFRRRGSSKSTAGEPRGFRAHFENAGKSPGRLPPSRADTPFSPPDSLDIRFLGTASAPTPAFRGNLLNFPRGSE